MRIKLNENPNTKVKRALFGDTQNKILSFAILSAENPCAKTLTPQENNKRTADFKDRARRMNIRYIPIEGKFEGEIEHSFMLLNLSLKDAKYFAGKYQQKSFFYGKTKTVFEGDDRHTTSQIGYYETVDPEVKEREYRLIEVSDRVENREDADDFFSRHGDFKYSITMDIFESLDVIKDMDSMLESLDDSYTARQRSMSRYFGYNGKLKR